MTISSLNPWQVLDQLHQDGLRRQTNNRQWHPPVDIVESADQYAIYLELAGVKPEQVKVELDDNVLKISGEKVRSQNDGETYRYKERTAGNFNRSFRLPENADLNNIRAQFEHGVLQLSIQKQEPAKPRRIEIQSA